MGHHCTRRLTLSLATYITQTHSSSMALLLPRLAGALMELQARHAWSLTPSVASCLHLATQPASKPAAPKKASGGKKRGRQDLGPRQMAAITMLLEHRNPLKEQTSLNTDKDPRTEKYKQQVEDFEQATVAAMAQRRRLQEEALAALPPRLREQAMQPDLSPFPPARTFFLATPPRIYMEPEAAAPQQARTEDGGALSQSGPKASAQRGKGGKNTKT